MELMDEVTAQIIDELDDYANSDTLAEVLKSVSIGKQQQVTVALQSVPIEKLGQLLLTSKVGVKRSQFWLINCEYTRRGIPPVFRNLPDYYDLQGIPNADLFWVDLEWLSARHHGHKPFNRRWKSIFEYENFYHPTAEYIWRESEKSPIWKVVKGLALEDSWQSELHVIKTEKHHHKIGKIESRLQEIEINLRAKLHARGVRYSPAETETIIRRRVDIWVCAVLADCSPQRTAQLYEAKSGMSMTRQVASNTIQKIERDIPTAFRYIHRH